MQLETLVKQFGGHGSLAEHFRGACAASAIQGAAVALAGEDECHTLAFGRDGNAETFTPTTRVNMNCVSNLCVSALVVGLIRGGEVALEDEVERQLDFGSAAPSGFLGGISIRHLLSHTDGIGYRGVDAIPATESGYVDLAGLASVIRSDERAFAPGRYCSEALCGFALLEAVVEKHSGMPVIDTLRHTLLDHLARHDVEPAGSASVRTSGERSERAGGGADLALNAVELGQFLRLHLSPETFDLPLLRDVDDFSFLFEPQVQYPGWAPSTKGAALGWKTFAEGWVGHNGVRAGHTVFVRLHPSRRAALAFLCLGHSPAAYAALGRFVGHALPELSGQQPPRLLTDQEQKELEASRFVRSFGNKARRIAVTGGSPDALQLTTSETGPTQAPFGSGFLVPAEQNSFFVRQPNTSGMFFAQYLKSDESADFDLLWDIKTLWKRSSYD